MDTAFSHTKGDLAVGLVPRPSRKFRKETTARNKDSLESWERMHNVMHTGRSSMKSRKWTLSCRETSQPPENSVAQPLNQAGTHFAKRSCAAIQQYELIKIIFNNVVSCTKVLSKQLQYYRSNVITKHSFLSLQQFTRKSESMNH